MKMKLPLPPAWRASTFNTGLLGASLLGLVLMARPAPAEATRPLIRTATAIKNVKMSMPMEMKEISEKGLMGLDIEDAKLRATTMKQAQEYVSYRKGAMTSNQAQAWLRSCETSLVSKDENPFCRYERERTGRASPSRSAKARDDRREIASHLKEGNFEKIASVDYMDVVGAMKYVDAPATLFPIAKQVIEKRGCIPSAVSAALAYKIEEHFPASEPVDLSKKLYQKASSCGKDWPASQASFRLGLIKIWQRDCSDVQDLMKKVESAPEASQLHARAKYWRHYCASATGDDAAKKAAKEGLWKEHRMSFHNLAVNGDDETTIGQLLLSTEPQVAVRSFIRQDLNPVLRAGEALIKAGSPHLAAELFDRKAVDIGGLEPEVRLYTAVLLNRIGYALPKFKILANLFQDSPRMVSQQTLRLYFPLWYFDMVKEKDSQVDPLLILSLIRQESAFNKDARSVVGARGLMQVMPATARSIASVQTNKLMDPKTNINVGTKYFTKRLNQYDGDVEMTLAAYNAGFSRVDQWRKRYPTDNKMLFIDFIPFRETREYVSSILRNYYWYVKLYSLETAQVSIEGIKMNAAGPKVLAIMSANAGAAAYTEQPHNN